jgi:hypothetical protein
MPGTLAEATKTSQKSALADGPPFLAIEPAISEVLVKIARSHHKIAEQR